MLPNLSSKKYSIFFSQQFSERYSFQKHFLYFLYIFQHLHLPSLLHQRLGVLFFLVLPPVHYVQTFSSYTLLGIFQGYFLISLMNTFSSSLQREFDEVFLRKIQIFYNVFLVHVFWHLDFFLELLFGFSTIVQIMHYFFLNVNDPFIILFELSY